MSEQLLLFGEEKYKEWSYKLIRNRILYDPKKSIVKVPFFINSPKNVKIEFVFIVYLNKNNKIKVHKSVVEAEAGLRVFESKDSLYEYTEIPEELYNKLKRISLKIANDYKKRNKENKEQQSLDL